MSLSANGSLITFYSVPRIFTVVISLTSQQSNQFINLSEQEISTVDFLLYKTIYIFTAFPGSQIQDTVHKKLIIWINANRIYKEDFVDIINNQPIPFKASSYINAGIP